MEEIIDPELVICDPHHHLWLEPRERFPRSYTVEELTADTGSGHRIEKTVFIECKSEYRADGPESFRPIGETEFVVASEPTGLIAGIVGFADLRTTDIDDVLAAHVEAGAGRFRGIRQISAYDPNPEVVTASQNPPDLMSQPAFRSGFAALGRAGLSFDAWLYHPQVPQLADLARAHPEVTIIADHLGGPLGIGPYAARHEDALRDWRSFMEGLSTCSNVFVKLGGIGMPSLGQQWHEHAVGATSEEIARSWGQEIRWCIEQFGVDRCMFESNFPVDSVSFGYPVVWNAFKRITADASKSEKAALFHDTATRVYRI
jgi:predicted TIM-barrel fold metal-dependent hydrolase